METPLARPSRKDALFVNHVWVQEQHSHPAALPKQAFALSWWEAVCVLVHRQWKLTVRDGSLVRGRIIQVGATACVHGALQAAVPQDAVYLCERDNSSCFRTIMITLKSAISKILDLSALCVFTGGYFHV